MRHSTNQFHASKSPKVQKASLISWLSQRPGRQLISCISRTYKVPNIEYQYRVYHTLSTGTTFPQMKRFEANPDRNLCNLARALYTKNDHVHPKTFDPTGEGDFWW
ncbi:uncharacterized protein Bfra_007667 [Botrytis fragariae]|uniref:Uncharacterized protein n=1 Tax=Botrytis fragariae TaxID=1964551 RepID=A0A8H6APJ0_9HELO|nr:uncharacterized protein Bfra_007667 [Botrytis fragariae]KAF5871153.1 hypothetical protein Bfra_007667 [Botrytis fragariae]